MRRRAQRHAHAEPVGTRAAASSAAPIHRSTGRAAERGRGHRDRGRRHQGRRIRLPSQALRRGPAQAHRAACCRAARTASRGAALAERARGRDARLRAVESGPRATAHDRAGCPASDGLGADLRRIGHRQGGRLARHPPAVAARRWTVRRRRLRRAARAAAREPAVRPRKGRLHGRRPAQPRPVRDGRRRHAVFSTNSAIYRWRCRPSFCARYRNGSSCRSAAPNRGRSARG